MEDIDAEKLQLEEDRRKEWKMVFNAMDADRSGTLEVRELYRFLVMLATDSGKEKEEVKFEDVRELFANFDKDGDRTIEWEEFYNVVRERNDDSNCQMLLESSGKQDGAISKEAEEEERSEEQLKDMFNEIDKDQSGSITKKEALRAQRRTSTIKKLGIKDIDDFFEKRDINMDGTISFEEFKLAFIGTENLDSAPK